jgi:glycine C-acetyltransferase
MEKLTNDQPACTKAADSGALMSGAGKRIGTKPLLRGSAPRVTCRPRRSLPPMARRPLDFGSQDILNLGSHPQMVLAAFRQRTPDGPLSKARTEGSDAVERRLAGFVGMTDACMFPSAGAARHRVLRALAAAGDHILIDALAPRALMTAALASEARVHKVPHGWTECFANRLRQLRLTDRRARIVVVSEALHSFDSAPADLAALQALCRQNDAVLAIDVTNDLGLSGRTGRGIAEVQDMVGNLDVIFGDLTRTFLAPCGFAASRHLGDRNPLRLDTVRAGFRPALQDADLLMRCIDLVESDHGAWRRARVMSNALRLSEGLAADGFRVPSRTGPFIPLALGDLTAARKMADAARAAGCAPTLVEYEVAGRMLGHWELHVMADHTSEMIDTMIGIIARAHRLNTESADMPVA